MSAACCLLTANVSTVVARRWGYPQPSGTATRGATRKAGIWSGATTKSASTANGSTCSASTCLLHPERTPNGIARGAGLAAESDGGGSWRWGGELGGLGGLGGRRQRRQFSRTRAQRTGRGVAKYMRDGAVFCCREPLSSSAALATTVAGGILGYWLLQGGRRRSRTGDGVGGMHDQKGMHA